MSPGYGSNGYGNNLNCGWTITVQDGYRVALKFTNFQVKMIMALENNSDYKCVQFIAD